MFRSLLRRIPRFVGARATGAARVTASRPQWRAQWPRAASTLAAAQLPWVVQGGSVLPADMQAELEKVCRPVPLSYFQAKAKAKAKADGSADTKAVAKPAERPRDTPANARPEEWEGLTPADMQGMVVFGHLKVTDDVLALFTGLKVVSNCGVGVDHIDLAACRARQLWVGHTPNVLNEAVADHTFAMLLASARNVVHGDAWTRAVSAAGVPGGAPKAFGEKPEYGTWLGREAHGATIGIVGLGRIGLAVAKRADAFGMKLLYHNRSASPEADAMGAERASLDSLLQRSDFVVLLVPYSPATRHLIGAKQLQQMKTGATLINIGRGGLVDTDALVDALKDDKRQLYASLDVTDPEPLPAGHPLLTVARDRTVLAPHFGSATHKTRFAMTQLMVKNLERGLQGQKPVYNAYPTTATKNAEIA